MEVFPVMLIETIGLSLFPQVQVLAHLNSLHK